MAITLKAGGVRLARWMAALGTVGVVVAGGLSAVAESPVEIAPAAGGQIRISKAQAFGAPIGENGGISNPVALCPNMRVEPRTKWTLTNTRTGWSRTMRWTGALPGIYFPRVRVDTYESKTTATCRRASSTRTQTVRVVEKTHDGTVSRAEWRTIARGMSRAQVAEIIGTDGRDGFRWDGKLHLTYDMMAFWRWSVISYRDGRVVNKYWNVDHD